VLCSFFVMIRSPRYADQPQAARWAWTVVFWALAIVTSFLWFSIPP